MLLALGKSEGREEDICWHVCVGMRSWGMAWIVVLWGRGPWILHLEKRDVLLHGGFSLNNLMGRGVNVA